MTSSDLGFRHRFVSGTRAEAPTLLLLHGTGGDEEDLLPLGEALLPGASRLSPWGQVLENGMPRFFRRLAEGVFDLEDLRHRTHQLADFVEAAKKEYGLGSEPLIAVGFSNGANIAASLLLLRPGGRHHPAGAERSSSRTAAPRRRSGEFRLDWRRPRAHPGGPRGRCKVVRSFFSFAPDRSPAMVER